MSDLVTVLQAKECLDNLRLGFSPAAFGYRIQALAAHVLLRLDFEVEEINRSGHPDIVAAKGRDRLHFEVEAELAGPILRKLTVEDFQALTDLNGIVGYYALAISSPVPKWVVVPAERLKARKPSSNVLLEALMDVDFSHAWTDAYVDMLGRRGALVVSTSFRELRERALTGYGL